LWLWGAAFEVVDCSAAGGAEGAESVGGMAAASDCEAAGKSSIAGAGQGLGAGDAPASGAGAEAAFRDSLRAARRRSAW
jgi:hypothetical protein